MSAQRMDQKIGNTPALDADGRAHGVLVLWATARYSTRLARSAYVSVTVTVMAPHLVSFRGKRHKYGAHGPAGWWYS